MHHDAATVRHDYNRRKILCDPRCSRTLHGGGFEFRKHLLGRCERDNLAIAAVGFAASRLCGFQPIVVCNLHFACAVASVGGGGNRPSDGFAQVKRLTTLFPTVIGEISPKKRTDCVVLVTTSQNFRLHRDETSIV